MNGVPKTLTTGEVMAAIGISRPTLWRYEQDPGFPRARQLGASRKVFLESEIREWICRQLGVDNVAA